MSIASLLKLLLPHLVDFVASLLNPNKPGPTLERMSILVNIMLIVLLGYLGHGAWTIYEQHSDTKAKFEVQNNELKHLQEDVEEYRDQKVALTAKIERLQDLLEEERSKCVPSPMVDPKPPIAPPKKTKKKVVVEPKKETSWPKHDQSKIAKEINEG